MRAEQSKARAGVPFRTGGGIIYNTRAHARAFAIAADLREQCRSLARRTENPEAMHKQRGVRFSGASCNVRRICMGQSGGYDTRVVYATTTTTTTVTTTTLPICTSCTDNDGIV